MLFLSLGIKVAAQEYNIPEYINHLSDNPFLISPAYAGIGSSLQIRLNGVSQWVGVDNAPNTQSIVVETRLAERFGGGVTIFNDSNGFTSQQGARISFASHLTLSDLHDSFLSFGLSYSFIQFGQDTSEVNINDDATTRSINASNFDISMLYRFERFAISVNARNLLDRKVNNFRSGEPEILRQYTAYALYTFKISRDVEFEPSLFVRYFESDGRSKTDLNVKLRKSISNGYVWAGASVTLLNDQVALPNDFTPLIGIKKNNLYFSYGYGIDTNELVTFSGGSHSITLGFDYDRRPSLARCTQQLYIF